MDFNYEFIEEIFTNVWTETNFSGIVSGLKVLAIAFLLYRFIYTFAKGILDAKTIKVGDKNIELPISLWHIMTYLFYAGLIASYDYLLVGMDQILSYVVNIYTDIDITTVNVALSENDSTADIDPNEAWYMTFKRFAYQAVAMLSNPTLIIVKILKVLAWILDLLIYAIFIGQRFFVLLILKLIGPFAICLSLLPGFTDTFKKWISMYARWYFLIIPYFLANLVVASFVEAYDTIFVGFGSGYSGSAPISEMAALIEIPLILLIVILKPILYSAGKTIFNSLIDYQTKSDD